jgi:hypothetical protein
MSIKDLFGKTSDKILSSQEVQKIYDEVESEGYLEEISKDNERYLPPVDFSSASNFARYGSAEKYYSDAIKNIYQRYPYDGSRKEKQEWRNKSSQFDLHVFDNIYPKSTGYLTLSGSDISNFGSLVSSSNHVNVEVYGGPNNPEGNDKISEAFKYSNVYDASKNRFSNLAVNPENRGNTLEFWLKLEELPDGLTSCIFDLWNEKSYSDTLTRVLLEIQNNAGIYKFLLTYTLDSSGIFRQEIPVDPSVNINSWNHFAFCIGNSQETNISYDFYINGVFTQGVQNSGTGIVAWAEYVRSLSHRDLKAKIGAYRADPISYENLSIDPSYNGLGGLFGSIDELRFWKEKRTSQQIGRFWFTSVGGGTNTDDSNTELGIYFKFNEGVTGEYSTDSRVLDYSGRVSNGVILNYDSSVRNTGSAINEYSSNFQETPDPILYSFHPLVQGVTDTYTLSGSLWDNDNNANIYKSLPTWIVEEQENKGSEDLSNLVQIISSYFDTLHLQIENLPRLKDVEYYSDKEKQIPFISKILSSYDFENLDIFSNTSLIEELLSRSESIEFDKSLAEIKNAVYQNIYNNLTYIYKSKGTEKSLRNLIRCFGVDDELIKINLYADNSKYTLANGYNATATEKNFIDFNNKNRFQGFVCGYTELPNGSGSLGYIAGEGNDFIPLTLEAEIIFPKKLENNINQYSEFTTVSLFGLHKADDPYLLGWGNDEINICVTAEKKSYDSKDVRFKMSALFVDALSNEYRPTITTEWFSNVYNNEKWNFAVRIRPVGYSEMNPTSSSFDSYSLEFVGINSNFDTVSNSFSYSTIFSRDQASYALAQNKRIYAGAHYQDYDTSYLLDNTDVKISSVRFWYDYLTDEEIIAHSQDASSIGRKNPTWNAYSDSFNRSAGISKADTLALNWDFSLVTGSDSNGEFFVEDSSNQLQNSGELQSLLSSRYTGRAFNFPSDDSQVVNKEYIYSYKLQVPESITTSELIQIRDTDDINQTKGSKPTTFFYSLEKSMSQVISDEMLKWFATIDSFNNLIGEPIERYNLEYKGIEHLRKLFFNQVGNTPDFERFLEFYKWIDSSISLMIQQLIPASANISDQIRNIVESHVLERNKYQSKLPVIEKRNKNIVSTVTSNIGFSYPEQTPNSGLKWFKNRAERTAPLVSSGDSDVDANRDIIRRVINSKNLNNIPKGYDLFHDQTYEMRRDQIRSFSDTYELGAENAVNEESIINPITIQNTQVVSNFQFASASVTGSDQVLSKSKAQGNYLNKYEYFQASGRKDHNLGLSEIKDNLYNSSSNPNNIVDRTLPTRPVVKTVIVERFSAPGGPEVNGRGSMDAESEEYSAYNGLNNRNLTVRTVLNSLSAETSSIDVNNPSYHKVNKNRAIRATDAGTKNDYDNLFINHQIPRDDSQYAWITASLLTKPSSSGYFSKYDNLNVYNTSSATFLSGGLVNFVGLNLTSSVIKNVDTSSNTIEVSTASVDLNAYLSNINGPYQGAGWKQLRNSDNKVVQLSRVNNKILAQNKPSISIYYNKKGTITAVSSRRSREFTSYKESPVEFNLPMKHEVYISGSSDDIQITSTYDNNINRFANIDLSAATGIKKKQDKKQLHDKLIELKNGKYSQKPEIMKASHQEIIFPKKQNIGLKESRTKPNYEDLSSTGSVVDTRTFWRDSYIDRKRIDNSYDLFGFQTSSYEVLTNFTSSILGTFPIVHKINSASIDNSIFSLDNLTGSSSEYTGTIVDARASDRMPAANTQFTMSYGGLLEGAISPYSLPEHRYFILTASGDRAIIQTDKIKIPFEAFNYTQKRLIPRPQYVFNNFITPNYDYYNYNGNNTKGLNFPYDVNSDGKPTGYYGSYYGNVSNLIYFINNGYVYSSDVESGKAAFFDSYDVFNSDIKPKSIDYSIVPEYTIDNFMHYYVENGFNSKITSSYLTLDGASTDYKLEKSLSQADINEAFNSSNPIFNFDLQQLDITNNEQLKLNLKVSGIKKLLPYRGFYPSERVTELGSMFINSFIDLNQDFKAQGTASNAGTVYDFNTSNGTPVDQQILTLLQPLFAPGILMNTIKSSIAVDYPTIITSSVAYNLGSSSLPSFYQHVKGYNTATNLPTNYTGAVHISSSLNFRFPFESLIEFDTIIPSELQTTSSNLYYLNPTYYATDVVSGSDRIALSAPSYNLSARGNLKSFTFNNPLYKLAMHNFLAEIPNFFLANQLNNFSSKPEGEFDPMISGTTYTMDVVLEKDKEYREFVFNKYFDNIRETVANELTQSYLTLPGSDSLYGPPVRFFDNINLDRAMFTSSYYVGISKLYDSPAYAPYVPPYYYGKSVARLSFTPNETRKYSLDEILNGLTTEYINEEADSLFNNRSGLLGSEISTTDLGIGLRPPYGYPIGYPTGYDYYYYTELIPYDAFNVNWYGVRYLKNYDSSPAYTGMMKLSSSVNLFSKTKNYVREFDALSNSPSLIREPEAATNNSWVIQTKFETPSINFANITIPNSTAEITKVVNSFSFGTVKSTDALVGVSYKGLWTSYGQPVDDNSARIKLYLQENDKTNSLIKVCGFQKDVKKTIGKIADKKEISEAIVIIPYTFKKNHGKNADTNYALTRKEIVNENSVYQQAKETGPFYFSADRTEISKLLNSQFDKNRTTTTEQLESIIKNKFGDKLDNSIVKTINGMINYNLPPHLDWVRNPRIDPFAMYIFEFTHELDKQDLSDIWQNLMPKISQTAEEQDITISHNFAENEFFHGKKLPEDVRFKIFKIKKRANINYYKLTADSKDDTRFKFTTKGQDIVPEYSYNWPYDHFSLVELVKVEAGLEIDKKKK